MRQVIAIASPGHAFGHHDLLLLRRVHVSLAPHHELGAFHRAVSPDFRVVAIVAYDEAHLDTLDIWSVTALQQTRAQKAPVVIVVVVVVVKTCNETKTNENELQRLYPVVMRDAVGMRETTRTTHATRFFSRRWAK